MGSDSWYRDKNAKKFIIMLFFTVGFFGLELFYGVYIKSLALMSDAFHMLSDIVALLIGFMAVRMSKGKSSEKYSYGWVRAEVLGAFMNACFLLALCFTIILESIQRFVEPEVAIDGYTLVIVASVGLSINIVGMFVFGGHHHHHHDQHNNETASHPLTGSPNTDFDSIVTNIKSMQVPEEPIAQTTDTKIETESEGQLEKQRTSAVLETKLELNGDTEIGSIPVEEKKHSHAHSHKRNLNVQAVFLHAIGDGMASLGVIAAGLIIIFTNWDHKYIVDPLCGVLISIIIIKTTVPMLKRCAKILLQGVPSDVNYKELQQQLEAANPQVSIHDLHIWQLNDGKNIGSCHVLVKPETDFNEICRQFKQVFHQHSIHSTTIQPEFLTLSRRAAQTKSNSSSETLKCNEPNCNTEDCSEGRCCTEQKTSLAKRVITEKLVVVE